MKKIFTLLFCAATAFAANAQVEFIHQDKVVEDGATIELYPGLTELAPGFVILDNVIKAPYIKNTSSEAAKLTVKVVRSDVSQHFQWCGITTACMLMTNISETRSAQVEAGGMVALDLHPEFKEGVYDTYTATVTATIGSASRTIKVNYVYNENAGIAGTLADADTVRLNGKTLTFDFADANTHMVRLYGTDGRLVAKRSVSDGGSLDLAHLQNGVYLYQIEGGKGGKVTLR